MEPNSSKINNNILCKISKESVMDIVSTPLLHPRPIFFIFMQNLVGAPRTPDK